MSAREQCSSELRRERGRRLLLVERHPLLEHSTPIQRRHRRPRPRPRPRPLRCPQWGPWDQDRTLAGRNDDLIIAATRLKNAAPVQFNEFVAAFHAYTADAIVSAINANEHVFVSQGQARQCNALLDILANIGVRHG